MGFILAFNADPCILELADAVRGERKVGHGRQATVLNRSDVVGLSEKKRARREQGKDRTSPQANTSMPPMMMIVILPWLPLLL